MITLEKKKGKYIYGHCTQYRKKHKATYLLEEEFTKQLMGVFTLIQIPPDAFIEVSTALEKERADVLSKRDESLARIDAEVEKYSKRIERIYDDYLEDLITKETYERKHEEFQKAQQMLNQERTTFELDQNKRFDAAQQILKLSRNAPKIFEKANFEQKRVLLNMVLSNLELQADLLRWKLKKPFKMMAFCSENSNWLPLVDVLRNFESTGDLWANKKDVLDSIQYLARPL